ncbi:unnamed protein product [Mortierella alpina]
MPDVYWISGEEIFLCHHLSRGCYLFLTSSIASSFSTRLPSSLTPFQPPSSFLPCTALLSTANCLNSSTEKPLKLLRSLVAFTSSRVGSRILALAPPRKAQSTRQVQAQKT